MTDPEETLVRRARAGDRAAFEELVRRTSRAVYCRLFLETGDPHRAEDLLQETLLTAFRSLRGLQDPQAFRPWLLRIAQNAVIDASRREGRKKRSAANNQPWMFKGAGAEAGPEEEMCRRELRGQVLAALRSLPEEYRLPLTLRYIGGCDYDAICTQLGLTNGSLRGLLQRGLKLLRTQLPPDLLPGGEG